METIKGLKRTCLCAQVSEDMIGKEVTLMGWCAKSRNLGSIMFIDLRDKSGIIQLYFKEEDNEIFEKAERVHLEYVLAVRGIVQKRGGAPNPDMATGSIEIAVSELRILSEAQTTPFVVQEDIKASDELRLRYRYLDLRRHSLYHNLSVRSDVCKAARDYFYDNGFMEIETPILVKSTPEGARDYIVPSRVHPGSVYALPQSPQLYKQLLMASGMDRYIQIARCFRDEDLRADRQPEFSQIDLEMSFVEEDDVMGYAEGFIKKVFSEIAGVELETPFMRMTYADAMSRFGSDKPDLRFDMELTDISDIAKGIDFGVFSSAINEGGSVIAICAKNKIFPRKELDALVEFVKTYRAKGLIWVGYSEEGIKSSIAKFLTEDDIKNIKDRMNAEVGDTVFIIADKTAVAQNALGSLRCELAKRLDLIKPGVYKPLWVTEFPLLEYDEEAGRFCAMHHPFTSPMEEDIPLLDTDPGKVRARAYDIVINGTETGGGSIRICDAKFQKKMFDYLGFTEEQAYAQFGFLIDALSYGFPPHGGLAFGLERLTMHLCGSNDIRDVIAFPKMQNASEPMSGAPAPATEEQLKELGIAAIETK